MQEEKPVKTAATNSKMICIIIGICLLVGIVIVRGAFFHHRGGDEIPNVESNSDNTVVQGDVITFGAYEQDNNHSNGTESLEWIVLDRQDGKALLLSRYVIDCKQYREEYCDITWAQCDLREWLNTTFYESAFDEKEQRQIVETEVLNQDNEEYGTPGGVTTYDKVFLLSLSEVDGYFSSDEGRRTKATAYAMDSDLWTDDENYAPWWLRSPGYNSYRAAYAPNYGAVYGDGYSVNNTNLGVRPALWVRIEE